MKDKQKKENKVLKKIKESFSSSSIIFAFVALSVFVIFLLMIFMAEKSSNENLNTLFDAFWYILVTITTVGYGDIYPTTIPGRLLAVIMLLAGVAIFGALSGKFASFLFERQQKKDRGLMKMQNIKNHFLILGWKADFEKILEGILAANPEIPTDKVVLVNDAALSEMEKIKNNENFKMINWIKGDFTDEAVLLKAKIKTAERALILADHSENFSTLEIDSRTVLAAITVKNLNPRLYCVAEIINSKFEKHLSLAHCDEIILSSDYELNILFQASSGKGKSHIIRELVSDNDESGIVIENIPEEFIGKTYSEYKMSLSTRSILIGLLENTGNFYQRRKEALAEAQKNPDMQKIVSNLKKVKTLQSNLPHLIPDDDYIIPSSSKAIFIHGKNS